MSSNENQSYNSPKQTYSVKFKLLIVLLPTIFIAIFLLITVSYYRTSQVLTDNGMDLLSSSASNQADQIDSWLNTNLESLQAIKLAIESDSLVGDQLQNLMNNYYGFMSNLPEGFYIGDEYGNLYTPTQSSTHDSENVVDSIWYTQGLTRINMAYGSAYANENGDYVLSASALLLDGSDTVKVISSDISLNRISIIVNSLVSMESAEAMLIDLNTNNILASRDPSLLSTSISSYSDNDLLSQINDKIQNYDYSLEKIDNYILVLKTIPGTSFVLASYVPTSSIYGEITTLRNFMIVIGAIFLLIIILLTLFSVQVVLKPINNLKNVILNMSEGDFSMDIEVKGRDEISSMSLALKHFVHFMRGMLTNTQEISTQLFSQAQNSTSIASELSNSSQLQSDSMGNLNRTVDELSTSVTEIARIASSLTETVSDTTNKSVTVNNNMEETVSQANEGRRDMKQINDAMENIQSSIHSLETAINEVGEASKEITGIINVIGSIAEETNLLSLNASIEAARAGEAGKGFAVVAKEIGKLSNNSAASVQNISNLITKIHLQVDGAVKQANESAEFITQSSNLINTASLSFDNIFSKIQKTNEVIQDMMQMIHQVDQVANDIAAISEEQAASSEEILSASQLMVEESNHIADNSQTLAKDAGNLSQTSEVLGEQIQKFKL